jgi:hypothetical protein
MKEGEKEYTKVKKKMNEGGRERIYESVKKMNEGGEREYTKVKKR